MVRTAFTTHPVHGTDANAITSIAADLDQFNNTAGRSLVVTGNQTILLLNPDGGAAVHVTVPSANDAQNRKADSLIKRFRIPGGTVLPLPKFKAQGWSQGADGIHVNADETIHAEGTLTLASVPTVADTITLSDIVYTFRAALTNAGDIANGLTVAATLLNIAAAVNGTDGVNEANPDVAALAAGSTTIIFEAIAGSTAGNTVASTSSLTDVGSAFDATTLGTTVSGAAGSARLRFLVLVDPVD